MMVSARAHDPVGAGAHLTSPREPPHSVRVIHRVLVGLGGQRAPETIAADSIISLAAAEQPVSSGAFTGTQPVHGVVVCSRSALPSTAVPGTTLPGTALTHTHTHGAALSGATLPGTAHPGTALPSTAQTPNAANPFSLRVVPWPISQAAQGSSAM